MSCNNNNNCIIDIIENIINLQTTNCESNICNGCSRPYLGPIINKHIYNTRPISFYNCCTGKLWTMPYITAGKCGSSSVFRIESLDNNCIKCRILTPEALKPNQFSPTNSFFLISVDCISAIKCFNDIYLECE